MDESNLPRVDALAWVRARPQQFFGGREPSAIGLLVYLMADILLVGKGRLFIELVEDWWIVGSDRDWMSHATYADEQLFSHIVPAPEEGTHSMRGEILVRAFAADVWITRGEQRVRIHGEAPPESAWSASTSFTRAILFRTKTSTTSP